MIPIIINNNTMIIIINKPFFIENSVSSLLDRNRDVLVVSGRVEVNAQYKIVNTLVTYDNNEL